MCSAILSTDYINGKPPTTVYFIFKSIAFRWKVLSRQLRLNLLHDPLVFLQVFILPKRSLSSVFIV